MPAGARTYTKDLADRICAQLAQGKLSLRKICEAENVPISTVLSWRLDIIEFSEQYARARSIGADAEFEDIKDDAAELPPVNSFGMTDTGWVSWKKNQIDARKWVLARKRPREYGDKQAIEVTGEISLAESIEAARKRARESE